MEQFGPYRLDRLLGRGGMGEVYRAFDTRKRDRVVALKLLPVSLAADREYRARFQRECEIAASLREPHIVPIHDYGENDGRLYLDMRLVDGDDLAALIRRDGRIPLDRAVAICEQVAAALDAAHAEGLLHRDVKPSNILVVPGRPEFAYLLDFGIARSAAPDAPDRLTAEGVVAGTPTYMAPERFMGAGVDRRSDVYSLACVLYEQLVGTPPFRGGLAELAHAHTSLAPPLTIGATAALDTVIARAMAKNAADRYATATEFAAAVRQAALPASASTVTGTDLSFEWTAPPPALAPPATRTDSSARRRLGAALTCAAVLVGVGVWALLATDGAGSRIAGLPRPVEKVLTGHDGPVAAVSAADRDGRPVVVSAGSDGTVRVWDLDAGDGVGPPILAGSAASIDYLQVVALDGTPVISASDGTTNWIWDLRTGAGKGQFNVPKAIDLTNTGFFTVYGLTTSFVDKRPTVVFSSADDTVRVRDLASGALVTRIPVPVECWTNGLATGGTDPAAQSALFVGCPDGRIESYDIRSGAALGSPLSAPPGSTAVLATVRVENRELLLAGGADGVVRVWRGGTDPALQLDGAGDGAVRSLTTTLVRGRPTAVAGFEDGAVTAWDLTTGALKASMPGHTGAVTALAVTQLRGTPVLVSGSRDQSVRVWDLDQRIQS